jgi:hypothetical protein
VDGAWQTGSGYSQFGDEDGKFSEFEGVKRGRAQVREMLEETSGGFSRAIGDGNWNAAPLPAPSIPQPPPDLPPTFWQLYKQFWWW